MPKAPTSSRTSKGEPYSKPSQKAPNAMHSSRRTVQAMAAKVEAGPPPSIQGAGLRQILASKSKAAKDDLPADEDWEEASMILSDLDTAIASAKAHTRVAASRRTIWFTVVL
ncbi:hypothetical protein N7490_006690 [Penicillium lividum]|nr:hypothetical protein N7490_006690 [Penicillium lividum]